MAEKKRLFDSKTDPIPPVRPDLDIIPIENNGDSYLYFHDMLGYATPNFALNSQVRNVLTLLDGNRSVRDLAPYFGDGITPDQFLEYVRFLDEHRLLHSDYLKSHASRVEEEYEEASVHRSATAGVSYPADPEELTAFLDEAFSKYGPAASGIHCEQPIKALYAPHIDPRVGLEGYVRAFSAIRSLKPERVIILATTHYSEYFPELYANKPFILSWKDFEMPLGSVPADEDSVRTLLDHSGNLGVTDRDRAHRIEHSIELHLLFLSYLWDHDFRIVPILVRGFDDLYYMEEGHLGRQIKAFSNAVAELAADEAGEDTLFLISGDLSHVGKKFGDERPAEMMFDEIKSFDRMFLEYASAGEQQKLLELMKDRYDPYRVCGFAPLYSFLNIMPGVQGEIISYDLWDERERESAVSFGSIMYR